MLAINEFFPMAQKVLGNQLLGPQLPYLFFPEHELPNDTPAGNT